MESAARINIHNHVQIGLLGYEDVWQIKNHIYYQFVGILGFIFTNLYLAMNYFKKLSAKHVDFKSNLVNQIVGYNPDVQIRNHRNTDKVSVQDQVSNTHDLQKFEKKRSCKQKPCFFDSMAGKNLKEPLQVIYVLNTELTNLFVDQHQPEIAFNCKSLMEYQQSIGSQHTNNNQQQ